MRTISFSSVIGFVLFCAACSSSSSISSEPLVGGDRDEHGCIGSAGYMWCEPKQKCLRIWEEECFSTPEEAVAFELAMKYGKQIEEVHVTFSQNTDQHAKGSVTFGEGPGEGGLVLSAKVNGRWALVFDGNGSVDCAEIAQFAFPAEMMEGVCDL